MNRIIRQPKVKSIFASITMMLSICAIVGISGHVASVEAAEVEIPLELANKLRPAVTGEGALNTPFFNGAEEKITISSLKGKGIVLNFWATWCAPCVREMPALNRLAEKLRGTGVEVITVSADRKALKKVPPFFAANTLKNLGMYFDVKSALSRKVGVQGLPTTVLISADGQIVGRVMGVLEWDSPEIVHYLVHALGPKSP